MKSIKLIEKLGLGLSVTLLVTAYFYKVQSIQAILINLGTTILAASIASILKDWHWRSFFSKYSIDPNVIVYTSRANYNTLIEEIKIATEVDIMGISLQYTLEYLLDHTTEASQKIKCLRILLPFETKICDDRDLIQGTPIGSLVHTLKKSVTELDLITEKYPNTFFIRYFTLQPYFAFTRIDDTIWISPYVAKTGKSSPVLKISKSKSEYLYNLFLFHFNTVWDNSKKKSPRL